MILIEDSNATSGPNDGNFFDFEDVEDLDEIVDFRPHGESPRSSCTGGQSPARIQVRLSF